jgi:hypothetical protein
MGLAEDKTCRPPSLGKGGISGKQNSIRKQDGSMFTDDFSTCEARSDTREKPEVQELIEQRNRFLMDHPQLKTTQDEIDRLLSTTFDPQVRLEILFMLITEKLNQMKVLFGEVAQLAEVAVAE